MGNGPAWLLEWRGVRRSQQRRQALAGGQQYRRARVHLPERPTARRRPSLLGNKARRRVSQPTGDRIDVGSHGRRHEAIPLSLALSGVPVHDGRPGAFRSRPRYTGRQSESDLAGRALSTTDWPERRPDGDGATGRRRSDETRSNLPNLPNLHQPPQPASPVPADGSAAGAQVQATRDRERRLRCAAALTL